MSKLRGTVTSERLGKQEVSVLGNTELTFTAQYNWTGNSIENGEAVKVYIEHKGTEVYVRVFVFGELQYENAIQKEK